MVTPLTPMDTTRKALETIRTVLIKEIGHMQSRHDDSVAPLRDQLKERMASMQEALAALTSMDAAPQGVVEAGDAMRRAPLAWMDDRGGVITDEFKRTASKRYEDAGQFDGSTFFHIPLYRDPAPSTREKELEEALRKFKQHKPGCAMTMTLITGDLIIEEDTGEACSCGLSDFLAKHGIE